MTTHSSDASLVAGHLAGDPSALADIYDRYADPLHDTAAAMLNDRSEAADVLHDVILIAAERLGQLRDPDRLKPWLFAILRNEVYRRTKKRRQTIATDFSGSDDGFDMADEGALDPADDVSDDAASEDLAELVRNAARGLDDRDQLVLELSVRQGLGGQDLADALGVSTNQSYTLVHRMRDRVERSLTAYVVAKAGRQDCDDLDQILAQWDGEFTVLVRKRVARHVDACTVCDTRRSKVAPLAMFAAAPVYAAPAALRDQILEGAYAQTPAPVTPYQFTATDGFPQVVRIARRVAAWVAPTAAASLMLVAAGLGLAFVDRGDDDIVRDAAIVPVTTEAPSTTTTTEVPITATTIVLQSGRSGATNEALPGTSATTTATATADDSVSDADAPDPKAEPTDPATTDATAPGATPTATATPTPASPANNPPTNDPPPANAPPSNTPPPAAPPPVPPADPFPEPTTPTTNPFPEPVPPEPGQLSVGSTSLSLGSGSGSSFGSIALSNSGELPVTYSVSGDTGSFAVSPTSGTVNGGGSESINVSIDRTGVREGSGPSGNITITGSDGSSFPVALTAQVERPPVISGAGASSYCSTTFAGISGSAGISDETAVSASFFASGPNGQSVSDGMSQDGGTWYGAVDFQFAGPNFDDPSLVNGTWSWSISATDARGNTTTASGSTTVGC